MAFSFVKTSPYSHLSVTQSPLWFGASEKNDCMVLFEPRKSVVKFREN